MATQPSISYLNMRGCNVTGCVRCLYNLSRKHLTIRSHMQAVMCIIYSEFEESGHVNVAVFSYLYFPTLLTEILVFCRQKMELQFIINNSFSLHLFPI